MSTEPKVGDPVIVTKPGSILDGLPGCITSLLHVDDPDDDLFEVDLYVGEFTKNRVLPRDNLRVVVPPERPDRTLSMVEQHQVWAAMNYPDGPRWEVRGTGALPTRTPDTQETTP